MSKKVLFISYDGMTDPLGQSQVIPYLAGLSREGYQVTILSFEKPEKIRQLGTEISTLLKQNKIEWIPLRFHRHPRILSKAWDMRQMKRKARLLHRKNNYDLIHCRSYPAGSVGLYLKKKTGTRFLFDMRGFWADEKAEGGNWERSKLFWRKVYRYYKDLEKKLIAGADHIISLTEAGKEEIKRWPFYDTAIPVTVIPCCADTDLFSLTNGNDRASARNKLQIPENSFVLGYLGSVGAWYMLDEMIDFFIGLKKNYPEAIFLFVTNSDHDPIFQKLNEKGVGKESVRLVTVPYRQVPPIMKAVDICISFIKPVYSKMASSPTKNGEMLSMGIPLILNDIGDSGMIIQKCRAGAIIGEFSNEAYGHAIQEIKEWPFAGSNEIRNQSLEFYSLKKGVEKYSKVYRSLLGNA